jgi:probable rRNA maturation factor
MLSENNLTKKRVPKVPFSDIADYVLGPKYDLGLIFVGDTLSKRLNTEYRNKPKVANILSFPYTKKEGEIFIHLGRAESEAKKFSHTYRQHLAFLFIHGLLHLKGMDHSSRMESEEQKILKHFNFDGEKNNNRSGHRNIVDTDSRLRGSKSRGK